MFSDFELIHYLFSTKNLVRMSLIQECSEQTVETIIRLIIQVQSDLGLHQ